MTDHSLPHRLPLPLWPSLAAAWVRLRSYRKAARARRLRRLTQREIAQLSDHMLKDIGYFNN